MDIVAAYGKEIVSLFVPILTWVLSRFFSAKAKLEFSNPHAFRFVVEEPLKDAAGVVIAPTQTVHTRSLVCRNAGKLTLTRVEMVFEGKPQCVNVWPARQYHQRVIAEGRFALGFVSLAPNEYVGCEVFAINANVPNVVTVRSDQCVADWISMVPQPIVARWRVRLLLALAFAGLGLAVYLVLLLVQWLVLLTPYGH